ncbi:MAG: hypothetical protein NT061_06455 [Spirochaetes bacterium]|nr:hypothetical protein [Spirochaetota bacterium]
MKKILGAAMMAILVLSCSTTKTMVLQIDSIGKTQYEAQRSYIFMSTDQNVKSGDLRFAEYAGYIAKALARMGYEQVEKAEEANIIIYVTYGVGEPKEHSYSYSVPLYGIINPPKPSGPPPASSQGTPPSNPPFGRYNPVYGIVGSTMKYDSFTTYFRYCKIEAFDLKLLRESGVEKQLWSTIITSTGRSDDLRQAMPYMIAGAKDYIATDTGRKVEINVPEDNRTLEKL